jgi:hypothetical protein
MSTKNYKKKKEKRPVALPKTRPANWKSVNWRIVALGDKEYKHRKF